MAYTNRNFYSLNMCQEKQVIYMSEFLLDPISNGNPREQALIRRWWHEQHDARGMIVWEYRLQGKWADAIWFPDEGVQAIEKPGRNTADLFPLKDRHIVLCEAKLELNPEVVGQALVYRQFALHAGADVENTFVFCESGSDSMKVAATELGLSLVIQHL